tara:strand:+ start:1180 stop:1413 length:234 start_codon:yes stop_codon:yes gene_type:complete
MISFSHKDYRKGGLFFRTGGYKTPRRQKTVRGVSKLKAYNEQLKKLYPGYAAKLKKSKRAKEFKQALSKLKKSMEYG